MPPPSRQELNHALAAAQAAHGEFRENFLAGKFDDGRAGWIAAFVIGRIGTFATPTQLTKWLQATPNSVDSWVDSATDHVLAQFKSPSKKETL